MTDVRERLLDAARTAVDDVGWSRVTMLRLAETAGVSRQSVYNAFGSRHGLAQELAMRELGRFLAVVVDQMPGGPGADLLADLRRAVAGVLELADANPLVGLVVGSLAPDGRSSDPDFLAILTTDSAAIAEAATAVLDERLAAYDLPAGLAVEDRRLAADVLVRLVLSTMTRRSGTPAEAGAQLAWVASRLLVARA